VSLSRIRLIGLQHLLGKRHAFRWTYEYRSRANPGEEGIAHDILAEDLKADSYEGQAYSG
jgi:hypothetical protein